MGNWRKRYSSEHLEAADIPDGKEVTVKITGVSTCEVQGEKGKENKALIRFESSPRFAQICKKVTWVAAKTCGYCMEAMFGKDDAAWIGKKVTLHVESVEAFGDMADAVRVCGSPDITRPVSIRVKQGKRKVTIALKPTADPWATAPKQPAPQPSAPVDSTDLDDVPPDIDDGEQPAAGV